MKKKTKSFLQNMRDKLHPYILFGFAIAIMLFIIGVGTRIVEYWKLRIQTKQQGSLSLQGIQPKPSPAIEDMVLPANVVAWHDATIYARTNGYLVRWFVDIGAKVKEGDLLAKIDTPEVDAQLRQTEADLKTAEANYQLATITAVRWKNLLRTDSVSKQETDEKVSDQEAKATIVASTRANRDRLRDLVTFSRVIAPFSGIITSRTTDIGRLITQGGQNGAIPLFRIAQPDRLRVYVRVPQNYTSQMTPNLIAQLYFMEHPNHIFSARLLDSARAIDPVSRSLLVQFAINNKDYFLMPGSYAQVHIKFPTRKLSVFLPVSTLIFQSKGLQVAIVDNKNKVHLRRVNIGRDFGDEVEVVSGVNPQDTVVLNPPDTLAEGEKVKIHVASPAESKSKG